MILTRLLLPMIALFALAGCSGEQGASSGRDPGTLIRQSDSEIRGLDPQTVSDLASVRIAQDQFEGLTRFNASGEAEPGLAQDWTVSRDGLTWTFTLRPNLTFSDGTAITAELFAGLWDRLNDPATASPHDALFGIITAINAPDPRTVEVALRQPMPELPALLAHPALAALPLHRIAAAGEQWTGERPLVTSGPYRLTDWRLNDELTLEANPRWHGGAPAMTEVVWQPVDDPLSAMRLFLTGATDVAQSYPATRQQWLMERAPDAIRNADYLGSYYFTLNTRQPPFDDARVRRALSMAVDRDWIAASIMPLGNAPAWGVVPPALLGGAATLPGWADWPLDRRRALASALLDEAGFGPDAPLAFEIRINSSAEHRRIAVALAAMWREIGVEATILNSEATLHFAALRRGEFAMARSGWIGDLPAADNFLGVHRSDAGGVNYSGFADPHYDALLDAALAQADPNARIAAMRRAEAYLIGQAPIIPLYFYVSAALVAPDIAGWQDNPINTHPSFALSRIR